MNLHQRGTELINDLKNHLLEVLDGHPDAEPDGKGVLQEEIARRAGLHDMGAAELDHTCGELLCLLCKEERIEAVSDDEREKKKTRWRVKRR